MVALIRKRKLATVYPLVVYEGAGIPKTATDVNKIVSARTNDALSFCHARMRARGKVDQAERRRESGYSALRHFLVDQPTRRRYEARAEANADDSQSLPSDRVLARFRPAVVKRNREVCASSRTVGILLGTPWIGKSMAPIEATSCRWSHLARYRASR